MEKLGVIGGMGPLATAYFYEKIIKKTKVQKDQEHIDMIIYSMASIPDRTDFILGKGENPTKKLIEAAQSLEKAGATYLAMPCNTAHYFYGEIVKNVNIPFVNMVEETVKMIEDKGMDEVILLSTEGTFRGNVYKDILDSKGIKLFELGENERIAVQNLIYDIKKGDLDGLKSKVEFLQKYEEKYPLILGCTELSVLNDILEMGPSYIDPLDVLAKKVIEMGKK